MKKIIVGSLLAIILLSGCAGDKKALHSAKVGQANTLDATVINFPYGFSNVVFKCHGPNGIYVSEQRHSPVVVKNDPNCAPK